MALLPFYRLSLKFLSSKFVFVNNFCPQKFYSRYFFPADLSKMFIDWFEENSQKQSLSSFQPIVSHFFIHVGFIPVIYKNAHFYYLANHLLVLFVGGRSQVSSTARFGLQVIKKDGHFGSELHFSSGGFVGPARPFLAVLIKPDQMYKLELISREKLWMLAMAAFWSPRRRIPPVNEICVDKADSAVTNALFFTTSRRR